MQCTSMAEQAEKALSIRSFAFQGLKPDSFKTLMARLEAVP
jgi:hypothetical protein